eukprot:6206075-Pleurochrysis_carterae.AAC.1
MEDARRHGRRSQAWKALNSKKRLHGSNRMHNTAFQSELQAGSRAHAWLSPSQLRMISEDIHEKSDGFA